MCPFSVQIRPFRYHARARVLYREVTPYRPRGQGVLPPSRGARSLNKGSGRGRDPDETGRKRSKWTEWSQSGLKWYPKMSTLGVTLRVSVVKPFGTNPQGMTFKGWRPLTSSGEVGQYKGLKEVLNRVLRIPGADQKVTRCRSG